ncbi:hypothetical protein [Legionella tucsonensis]|uniref:Uncharacterized protein n=1 Tax=Legionella tucsonensis TaxID=40335 RepID=A0A0W0ZR60_9GAMM|nr:hypothetical protein [Legionella tucsonensis]KTD71544.1 hypothetical protein Ltuc_2526 [Legionella tucsonensis]
MGQIVGIVAAQLAADEAKKMLQNQKQNQEQNQEQNQSPTDDDQSPLLSAPSGAIFNSDSALEFASMLPKNLDSVLQVNGSKGGQNQIGSVLDEGEEILDQGISKGMSFLGK